MKNLKTIILTALISVILTSGICVVAVKISAKDVGFTASNEEWKVNNVNDAVNDLYESSKNAESEKIYIVKDGVVQEGYELILDNATQNYDNENGFLEVIKTNNTYIGYAAFKVDLTDYKYVCGTIAKYTFDSEGFMSAAKLISIQNSLTKDSKEVHASTTDWEHADPGIVQVDDLTGEKYIVVSGYYYNHPRYSFKIKDLWLEK